MRIAILSPHLDDAVLSCCEVLEGPADVTVVNVFTASPPAGTPAPWWDRLTGATDPVERMRERRAEDAAALALVGRSAVHLGLLDDQYRLAALAAHSIAERIDEAVDSDAALYAPGAFDGHVDHVLVRDAALELARAGRRVVIYADLPHAIPRGWPAWVSGEGGGDVGADWDAVLARAGLATAHLVHDVRSLDARARARKLLALAAYGTQRAELDRAGFAPLHDPRALAWEVSWDVTPSALAGAREVPASALGGPQELTREPLVADAPGEPLDDRL